ncbi:hypothetical protein [Hamadaea tsunoensis]|uniref:hypothetical protein n=1 Tax=Hamadaea tsunoensis TaxID=53368 RepID=UPI0004831735|nr:hypothetical protein [Hamadaea tsunoensis]
MTMGCRCHELEVAAIMLARRGRARQTYRITMRGYLVGPGYVHTVADPAEALQHVGLSLEQLTDLD